MRKNLFLIIGLLLSIVCVAQPEFTKENAERAASIVSKMTLREKAEYVGGFENWYIRAIDRLGLPAVRMAPRGCGIIRRVPFIRAVSQQQRPGIVT